MSDLVKRLRGFVVDDRHYGKCLTMSIQASDVDEAAATIEAQAAEIETKTQAVADLARAIFELNTRAEQAESALAKAVEVMRGILIDAPEGKTFIYFLRAGEFVKIGRSKNWRYRMAGMQVGSPYTIVPLLVLIGDESEEKKLHHRFRESRFRGEWFRLSEAIREYIKGSRMLCVAKADVCDLRTPNKWEDAKEEIVL